MRITVDTNVLVRVAVRDDPAQTAAADQVMREASVIAIALPTLCEFVWVVRKVYRFTAMDVHIAIETLLAAGNVLVNRPAVEAGLAMLKAGGDFADGAIAHEGHWLGGETFVSFDQKAVTLLSAQGHSTRLVI